MSSLISFSNWFIVHSIITNSVYTQIKLESLTSMDYEYDIFMQNMTYIRQVVANISTRKTWDFQTDLGTWISNQNNLMRGFSHRDNSGLPHPSIRAPVILPPHTHTHLNVHNFLIATIKTISISQMIQSWHQLKYFWFSEAEPIKCQPKTRVLKSVKVHLNLSIHRNCHLWPFVCLFRSFLF